MDMDTSKMTYTPIINMPYTVITIMVQLSVGDTIFTLRAMLTVTGILILIVTRTKTVHTATTISGQETIIFAQMR